MLTIVYGKCPEVIYNTPVYFDFKFKKEWINNTLYKEMILDIDKSKVIGDYIIESEVLGLIPPQMLSGGVKTLILIDKYSDKIFNGSQMGNNCAKWLLDISKRKDIVVWFGNLIDFDTPNEIKEDLDIKVEWDNRTKSRKINNMIELMNVAFGEDAIEFYEELD